MSLKPAAWPAAAVTLDTFYIRHGQSQWNAAQTASRRSGVPEDETKALGRKEEFTDSPLSALGVRQGLNLQRRLFEDPVSCAESANNRSLAVALACREPVLLTSNLRRAVDTTLLAMRPLVDRGRDVVVLPALQETCSMTDCTPSPRQPASEATGRGPLAPAGEAEKAQTIAEYTVLSRQREAREQAAAEEAGTGAAADGVSAFLDAAYPSRLTVAPHTLWNDRRSVPDDFDADPAAVSARLRPFLERLADVLDAMLQLSEPAAGGAEGADGGAARAAPARPPVVIGAHSRFLRELLYAFHTRQQLTLTRHPPQPAAVQLAWDGTANAAECAALASQETRMANCGTLAFELRLAPADAAAGAAGGGAEQLPRLTLANCRLDAGAAVLPRREGAPPPSAPAAATAFGIVGGVLALCALMQLYYIGCAILKRRRHLRALEAGKKL